MRNMKKELTRYDSQSNGLTWTKLSNHTVSSAVDIVKTYQYGYQLGLARSMGSEYATAEQIIELQEKRLNHFLLGTLGATLFMLASISALEKD